MAETYGELICQLCQLRDQMKMTPAGREALVDVIDTLAYMDYLAWHGMPVTYEKAKELIEHDE